MLIKLWKKLPETDTEFKRFRAWLCTVTGNVVHDFRRKSSTRQTYEAKSLELQELDQPDIERIAQEEWQKFIVTQAIENITANFSSEVMDVFNAVHQGQSLTKVSNQLNLPVNTVSVYKGRVLKAVCREVRRLEDDLS